MTVERLHRRSTETAVVSNADSRMRMLCYVIKSCTFLANLPFLYTVYVLRDLELPRDLGPITLSEDEGIEKPSPEIFWRTLHRVNEKRAFAGGAKITPAECLHIGDEIDW